MTVKGLLQAQLGDANSPFWWAAKLTGLALLYLAIITIPRPQSAASVEQGICSKTATQFVCSCVQKPPAHTSVCTPKVGSK
jgi:hypothetical protein